MKVASQMIEARRLSLLWWGIGVFALIGIGVLAWPAIKDSGADLEAAMATLPEGLLELFGAANGLASPSGYLNSQVFATTLPIILIVFAVGLGGAAIAGAEADRTLEMTLANPITRLNFLFQRLFGLAALLVSLLVISLVIVVLTALPVGLLQEISFGGFVAVNVGVGVLAFVFGAMAFAIGAATGNRVVAFSSAGAFAIGLYVFQAVVTIVPDWRQFAWISPWDWFLRYDLLVTGLQWVAVIPGLIIGLLFVLVGAIFFNRRDLG